VARFVCRFPLQIVIVAALLTAVSVIFASRNLQLNANTDDLIGPDLPFYQDYRAFLDEFGDLEYIYVVVADAGDTARTKMCVDALARGIADLDMLPGVYAGISTDDQLRVATRAMPEDQLEALVEARPAFDVLLGGVDVDGAIDAAADMLEQVVQPSTSVPPDQQRRLGAGAIFLLEAILGRQPGLDPPKVYLVSETGKLYFIAIAPAKDYGTLALIEEPLNAIRGVIAEVRKEFTELEIGLTGRPVLQADEMMTTSVDMTRASIMAIVLISLLFMIVMGSIWRPALAILALLCSLAWTFGFATLTLGYLNLLSIVFTLVLVGVGIDFGAHLLARYREHRRTQDARQAVTAALLTAGRGNVTGAVTSSMAFYMALFTDFQGLQQLGLLAGTGLILSLIAMIIVLPAMLVLLDRRAPKGRREPRRMFVDRWLGRPVLVLGIGALATIVLFPAALRVGFEENLLQLQAVGLESVEWEQRIIEDSVAATWFGAVIVDSIDEIPPMLDRARQYDTIGRARSVLDVVQLPTEDRQRVRGQLVQIDTAVEPAAEVAASGNQDSASIQRVLPLLSAVADLAAAARQAEAEQLRALHQQLQELGAAVDGENGAGAVAQAERNLETAQQAVRLMLQGNDQSLRDVLPGAVRNTYTSKYGDFMVSLHPDENVWNYEQMAAFVADLRAVDPEVTGAPIASYESLGAMKRSFLIAASYAMIAVAVLILLDFRHLGHMLLAMAPLLLGVVWTIELMGVFGLQFNLANFFAVPILIGVGVDNGVHILHRYRENRGQSFTLGSTRRAAILTSLTTMAGFGCLALASHLGLRSLGLVMVVGSAACLIATVVILPAALVILAGRNARSAAQPGTADEHDGPVRGERP
jgi:hypothetical protein